MRERKWEKYCRETNNKKKEENRMAKLYVKRRKQRKSHCRITIEHAGVNINICKVHMCLCLKYMESVCLSQVNKTATNIYLCQINKNKREKYVVTAIRVCELEHFEAFYFYCVAFLVYNTYMIDLTHITLDGKYIYIYQHHIAIHYTLYRYSIIIQLMLLLLYYHSCQYYYFYFGYDYNLKLVKNVLR